MRTDVGSIPLMCILSTLTSGVFGYLPTEDLTNSIMSGNRGFPVVPTDTIIPTDGDEDSSPGEDSEDTDSVYRKKTSTFRRRNINTPFGGRVPFSRTAYKAGYGSNRIGGFPRTPSPLGGFYGNSERSSNPYGTINLGGGSLYPGAPEEYNIRPSAPYSGLIGGSRAGYYGSTVGMRRGGAVPPMSSRNAKMVPPQTEYPPDYASNDLMNSFNGATNSAIPSLRELATYASRYGPAYLRERFGAHENPMERLPYGGGPQIPPQPRGGGMPIDFNMNIALNHWNKGPMGIMSRDVDSYQHDDAVKTNKKASSTMSSPGTSTRKPRKARKPVKKSKDSINSTTTTTTTSKQAKKSQKPV